MIGFVLIVGGAGVRLGMTPPQLDVDRFDDRSHVADVLEGDLLRLADGTRVRLIGIDCNGDLLARDATRQLLHGQEIRLRLEDTVQRNAAGELLAYAYVGDVAVNEMLLREGLAFADRRWQYDRLAQFKSLEQEAAHKRLGVWTSFPNVPLSVMPAWRQRWWTQEQKPMWEREEWNTEPV